MPREALMLTRTTAAPTYTPDSDRRAHGDPNPERTRAATATRFLHGLREWVEAIRDVATEPRRRPLPHEKWERTSSYLRDE